MKKGKTIAAIILTAAAAAARIMVEQRKEDLIIEKGISGYRTWASTSTALLIAAAALAAILLILQFSDAARKHREEEAAGRLAAEAAEKSPRAPLSVDGVMNPGEIRNFLIQQGSGEWRKYRGNLGQCVDVMDDMSDCRARLHKLLEMNGADTLRDTEDVLRQVEQYICRNRRKIINNLSAVDIDSPDSEPKIQKWFSECISDSMQKLDKVNEFIVSLSEFFNSQGEDSSSLDMLDIYKGTILESIARE